MVDRFEAIQNTLCARFISSENFATQSREENIWYFWPSKADSSPCAVNVWIAGFSQINQLANEIGILAHVISKLKMHGGDYFAKREIMLEKSYLCPVWLWRGKHGKYCFKRLSIQSMELSECIVVFRHFTIHVEDLGMPLVAEFSKSILCSPCLSALRSPAADFSN